jgi:hypothetical protein
VRINQLDAITMARLVRELCAAHGKPFGAAAEAQVNVYYEALEDCNADEVERAVKTACRSFDRFPKPSALRALIFAGRPKRFGSDTPGDPSDTCQHCNTRYQWRRLPHWVKGDSPSTHAADLQCDCGWRLMVKGYATDDDLAEMGPNDPFAANEIRRRANLGRAA